MHLSVSVVLEEVGLEVFLPTWMEAVSTELTVATGWCYEARQANGAP